MQLHTQDLVIYDYEIDIGRYACILELEFYSQGLLRFPSLMLQMQTVWGVERRPGVVDIYRSVHQSVIHNFEVSCFDLSFATRLENDLHRIVMDLTETNTRLEHELSQGQVLIHTIKVFFSQIYDLMAFHIVNWMLPFDKFRTFLEECLGSATQAKTCLKSFMVPSSPAHMTDFFLTIVGAAEHFVEGSWNNERATDAARAIGMLQTVGIEKAQIEDPDRFTHLVESYVSAEKQQAVQDQAELLQSARDAAHERRNENFTRSLACALRHDGAFSKIQAIEKIARAAADAEEKRKVLQLRSLRNLRELLEYLGLPITGTTHNDVIYAVKAKVGAM